MQNDGNSQRCVPWFYPVEDKYLYEICDPWQTRKFQKMLKEVSDDQCKECLPDCRRTKYKTRISSAPFNDCDRTNLGISSLCDLNTDSEHMMFNPPIWKNAIQGEYENFNNGSLRNFMEFHRKSARSVIKRTKVCTIGGRRKIFGVKGPP